MQRGQLEGAVKRYLRVLKDLCDRVNLSPERKSNLAEMDTTPIQTYLLQGADTPDAKLIELAARGVVLLKSGDRALHSEFTATVLASLKGAAK